MKILITGGAGFIGSACAKKLMDRGDKVVIIDNFNDYYNPKLKYDRLKIFLKGYKPKLYKGDIRDAKLLEKIFKKEKIDWEYYKGKNKYFKNKYCEMVNY